MSVIAQASPLAPFSLRNVDLMRKSPLKICIFADRWLLTSPSETMHRPFQDIFEEQCDGQYRNLQRSCKIVACLMGK